MDGVAVGVPEIVGVSDAVPDTVRLLDGVLLGDGVKVVEVVRDTVGVNVFEPDAPPLIVFEGVGSGVGVRLGDAVGDGLGDALTTPWM